MVYKRSLVQGSIIDLKVVESFKNAIVSHLFFFIQFKYLSNIFVVFLLSLTFYTVCNLLLFIITFIYYSYILYNNIRVLGT
ncbi:Putative phage related protein [Wolbachia endosymbiont wPip_Mol of Culex molestus]|nr:Putative phage related protein [Wolbachia endosymbiont of Culex quinquefasciatus Pel]CQD11013.1 Putative phage related protein [Wolbachia endosymbiont wPip_Mol of Culex molestus]